VARLSGFLWDERSSPLVSPKSPHPIPLWMLGSSPDSAVLAAQRGLPYNLGLFINPQADSRLISLYKSRFQPSAMQATPHAILTISVFCADTREQAEALQLTHDLNLFRFFTGQSNGASLTPQQALAYAIGPREEAFIASRQSSRAAGTPAQVREQIEALAAQHGADEIMAVTNMYYFEDRKRSFKLLRDAFA